MKDNLLSLRYTTEPTMFGPTDIEPFMMWSTGQGTSDVTIQNEEKIVCEIHGKKIRVTNRKMSQSELINMITTIYKSDGAISKLNSGEDVDLPWNIRVDRDTVLRFRVNMTCALVAGHKGYSITIRTISSRPHDLETLNLPQQLIDNLSPKQGLIVVVGATGSGKSTLLASVLSWRMRKPEAHLKILTYEAPIEYVYDEIEKPSSIISQAEIGTHLPSFAAGVRNALRRKPDIILVGEMRDEETIGEAINASMTGHLVYGTLHSNTAATAVRRMINVFDSSEKNARTFDILSSLKMIVAQQLLPSTDGRRVAIREYLVFTEDIVNDLLDDDLNKLTYNIEKMVGLHGQTFLQDAQQKLEEGLITEETYEEVKKLTKGAKRDVEAEEVASFTPEFETEPPLKTHVESLMKNQDAIIRNKDWQDL